MDIRFISKKTRLLLASAFIGMFFSMFSALSSAELLPGRGSDNIVVRSAVFDGVVLPENREQFRKNMEVLKQMVTQYPGIRDVRVRYMSDEVAPEEGAPHPYVTFDFYFNSVEDMDKALATPLRQETRDEIQKSMPLFKGKIYHFVREESGVSLQK